MSTPSLGRLALSIVHQASPMRVTLELGAGGWKTAACVWCVAVGSVGILGHGVTAAIALGVLGISTFVVAIVHD